MFARDAISKIAEVGALGYNGANMPNPNSIVLAATAEAKGLKSVLVGGNAVNLYGYHRTTFDVDLLVREKDSAKWVSFFERHGYKIFQQTSNFTRLNFADDPAGALPVDLMLADDDTFRKIHAESRYREIGKDIRLAIPSPLHLVAMKLHALKSPPRLEQGLDLQDVIHLIKSATIDIHGREFRVMRQKRYEAKSSTNLAKNRVHEGGGTLDLPRFDSLPATVGLTITEAFRLSIEHALALLPAVSKEASFRVRPTNPERFSLQ